MAAVHLWSAESVAACRQRYRQRSQVGARPLLRRMGSHSADCCSGGTAVGSVLSHSGGKTTLQIHKPYFLPCWVQAFDDAGASPVLHGMFWPLILTLSRPQHVWSVTTKTCVVALLSSKALVSINVVALHCARLVLGWVTICGQVDHLGIASHLGQLSLPSLQGG